jgi:hypothetical protein
VTVTLEVGAAQRFEQGAMNGRLTLGSACSGDATSDAMVPYKLTMTNGGASDEDVSVVFGGVGGSSIPDFHGPTLAAESSYSDGPNCAGQDGASSFGAQKSALLAGSSVTNFGFFIISGAYDGAGTFDQIMDDTRLTVSPSQTASDTGSVLQVKSASGPGLTGSQYGGWVFVLSGSNARA